jgi:hypothetical protein
MIADHRTYLLQVARRYPRIATQIAYPGIHHDSLYDAEYDHPGKYSMFAMRCSRLLNREARLSEDPVVHYGLIASSDQVMGHGATTDRVRKKLDVLCFETEAAGLMDRFPCLVIWGICDYADSHENKRWQAYAAATAAAYAKEIFSIIPVNRVDSTRTMAEETNTAGGSSSCRYTTNYCFNIVCTLAEPQVDGAVQAANHGQYRVNRFVTRKDPRAEINQHFQKSRENAIATVIVFTGDGRMREIAACTRILSASRA